MPDPLDIVTDRIRQRVDSQMLCVERGQVWVGDHACTGAQLAELAAYPAPIASG